MKEVSNEKRNSDTVSIVFICGALEPGKDGVGDYTRRLAAALSDSGIKVAIVALRDPFVSVLKEEFQDCEGSKVSSLRVPASWAAQDSDTKIKKFIDTQDPDWLSLQFVLYAYNKKGLPFGLGNRLKTFGKNRKWHIMFHEIWIGWAKWDSISHRIIGKVQKQVIRTVIKALKPAMIHTQTQIYQHKLNALGWPVENLPLFSNIPLVVDSYIESPDNEKIELIIFGAVHPNTPVELFVKEVSKYRKAQGQQIELTLIGRNGNEALKWVELFKSEGIPVQILGELSTQKISNVLRNSTIGITTTPTYLLEKSGTIAAMRLHSLPIVCVSRTWMPDFAKSLKITKDVLLYQPGNFKRYKKLIANTSKNSEVSEVAKTFISDLGL